MKTIVENGKKQIVLDFIGYKHQGTALIQMWGGDYGVIEMKSIYSQKEKLSVKDLNDAGFGCQKIIGAYVNTYENYEGYFEYKGSSLVGDLTEKQVDMLTNYDYLNF